MILGFKAEFKPNILDGSKIHTIRLNPKNWRKGLKIHFATGVRTKDYDNFMMGECVRISELSIDIKADAICITSVDGKNKQYLTESERDVFARNDGFENRQEMYDWFIKQYRQTKFAARLIFWKDTDQY